MLNFISAIKWSPILIGLLLIALIELSIYNIIIAQRNKNTLLKIDEYIIQLNTQIASIEKGTHHFNKKIFLIEDSIKNMASGLKNNFKSIQSSINRNNREFVQQFTKFRNEKKIGKSLPQEELYKINKQNNLEIYKKWTDGTHIPVAKRNLKLLITLMENDIIPTEFPRFPHGMPTAGIGRGEHIMEALYFDPEIISFYESITSFECIAQEHGGVNTAQMIINKSIGDVSIKCPRGNQIYHFNETAENLDDSWGNDIVFPGKGNDILDLGWGQDIVILEENWGHKEIKKTCHNSRIPENVVYTDYFRRPSFLGVGLEFKHTKDFLLIVNVIEGSGASKAGLKAGDRITKISDQLISEMNRNDILNRFRGGNSKAVEITYNSPNNKSEVITITKSINVVPSGLNVRQRLPEHRKLESYKKINYRWPYKYNNFIVFGPNIHETDVEWNEDRTLTHKVTGDKITFANNNCFEFIFSKNVQFIEASSIIKNNKHKVIGFKKYNDIPHLFLKNIKNGIKLNAYIKQTVNDFTVKTNNKNYKKIPLIEQIIKLRIYQARKAQLNNLLRLDQDLSDSITKEEIVNSFTAAQKKRDNSYIQELLLSTMKLDTNFDKSISRDEMVNLTVKAESKIQEDTRSLYSRHLDKNEFLTEKGIHSLGASVFSAIDKNNDGIISEMEYRKKDKNYQIGIKNISNTSLNMVKSQ